MWGFQVLEQKAITFKDLLEIPFEFGKTDCWWLVREVFSRYGIIIPDYSASRKAVADYNLLRISKEMEYHKSFWVKIEEPEIPCIVALSLGVPGFINHVGVYIGDGRFIHTTCMRGMVTNERIDTPIYRNKKFYRYDSNNSH